MNGIKLLLKLLIRIVLVNFHFVHHSNNHEIVRKYIMWINHLTMCIPYFLSNNCHSTIYSYFVHIRLNYRKLKHQLFNIVIIKSLLILPFRNTYLCCNKIVFLVKLKSILVTFFCMRSISSNIFKIIFWVIATSITIYQICNGI